jgi:hypothetical protein
MRSSWQTVIDSMLRPARPHLARCLAEREKHFSAQRAISEERARAIRDCERRIEQARAIVFARQDGIVPLTMTELEREWRVLSRPDLDGALMDLWARIAPPSWIDRKRWRDSDPTRRVDAAVALAADVEGVERAEMAIRSLRPSSRVRFRLQEQDSEHAPALFGEGPTEIDRAVYDAMRERFPDRPLLARDVARVAFLDRVQQGFALVDLWKTGYVIAAMDASWVTLEIPPL